MIRPDGSLRHVLVQGVGHSDGQGCLAATFGILLDVTEAVEAERVARENGEVLRATFEAIDQGIVMVGADQRIRVMNGRARDLLGLPEHLTQPDTPFAAVLRYQKESGEFAHLSAADVSCLPIWSDEANARPYTRRRLNGIVLDIRTAPMADGGFVRTYSDVSEQVRREHALRLSEQRLVFALESGGDGVWSYDCARDRIVLAGRWWSILGYEEGAIEPTYAGWNALTHPDDRDRVRDAMIDHLKGRTASIEIEYRIASKSGAYV